MLVETLCASFRLSPEKIGYVEEVEMVYIYRYIERVLGITVPSEVIAEIPHLGAPISKRGKRKRLYQLFLWCQARSYEADPTIDTTTERPPIQRPYHENYY